ncbi:ATP-binding protein [Streptomyces sp. NPDC026673]|uniref:ATP-binding protein n=1 Tax=Streptomyces sp. NPDC026673 TaxID=3155724 RepID=UPI0033F520D6
MIQLAQHSFCPTARTVRTARDFAMRVLDSWGGCARREDIRVCVSEMAGNAVVHGARDGRGYVIRIALYAHCVHLEVSDERSGGPVRPVLPAADETGGRGLFIVQALSDDWGVDACLPAGKVVWTCFRRPGPGTRCCSRPARTGTPTPA